MANSKISALTAATTVAGTEVLPIVQSSATVKVAISDLNPGLSTILATKGGTGQTSYAVGDLLYASTTTALSKLADVATGNALISGGVSTAPSWGKIGLTTHVSGILPVANGGSGTSTAFTAGSVVFAGASGVYSQDNATFFWDTTNKRLGLGATAPAAALSFSKGDGETNGMVIGHPNWANTYYAGIYGTVTNGGSNTQGILRVGTRVNATDATLTNIVAFREDGNVDFNIGNLVPRTAAKGVNFLTNTPAAGMTSQLLNWYEEGTWTPTITAAVGTGYTTTANFAKYTRVGRLVTIALNVQVTAAGTASGIMNISGLPFTSAATMIPSSICYEQVSGIAYLAKGSAAGTTAAITTLTGTGIVWAYATQYNFTLVYQTT